MKLLHTADWHLGHRFLNNERSEEHSLVLSYIIDVIKSKSIDVLIVAGDIFDVVNPSNSARKLYYNFLKEIIQTNCKHIVFIGGNHDSPAMLEAPKDLLEAFSIHVVGSAPQKIEEEILEFHDENNQLELVIAAVPFLRDRDLIAGESGQNYQDKIEKIRNSIKEHYHILANEIESRNYKNIPIVATGHLFATGSKTSDKQENIYIGDLDNISGAAFPKSFTYVALGHIHRAQRVGGLEHIRYSGSIIPKTFKETADSKSIVIIEFKKDKISSIEKIPLPIYRKLIRIKCTENNWQEALDKIEEKYEIHPDELEPWIEIKIELNSPSPSLYNDIRKYTESYYFQILKISVLNPRKKVLIEKTSKDLSEMTAEYIFLERISKEVLDNKKIKKLVHMHKEIIESLNNG